LATFNVTKTGDEGHAEKWTCRLGKLILIFLLKKIFAIRLTKTVDDITVDVFDKFYKCEYIYYPVNFDKRHDRL